jgi:hypothetical protein
MEQLAHQKSAIEKHVQYVSESKVFVYMVLIALHVGNVHLQLYGVNGVHGLNVLHVVYPFGVEPEIVLILNLRMGDFHVQGLGMTLRNVNQINHALVK